MSDHQHLVFAPTPTGFVNPLSGQLNPALGKQAPMCAFDGDLAYALEPQLLTTVLIGASSPVFLFGLQSLVLSTTDLFFGGAAQNCELLLQLCAGSGEGVALVTPFVGQASVRDFLSELKARAPGIRVVLMTDAHNPHLVREAVTAGVCGLVAQTAQPQEIFLAVHNAAQGRRYIAPAMAAHLAESLSREELTCREMQVLRLLSQGDCNKTIARILDVTVGTVKSHVRSIMNKLASGSRTEAVRKAWNLGLVGPDP